ncbi:outer membrane protein/peptidoglycan-associated (lipo)protein [Bernardetia litoralis DSM 6794]|uniref:Outer membrane protein/peptidoglycan-associated (Lipo)protein n=1 Tax=Bernardetia litoralis (strain ATCC 23117 / DSM 6794 / NBRC 15988 / NCIMB 1366 / Fx l1 / Sio-4) TaxID=880071 RepID=I4AMC8_BERLS|nr:OmpA family protein [Bernardetia litoralis]AFM05113.1 outer membrane protein/peptidoglycan-associated (lipo)protein [Bernardetia litoralis DSM 6794]
MKNLKTTFQSILIYTLILIITSFSLSSCASWSNTGKGAVIGGIAGGVIGGVASKKNTAAGGAIGAVVGGAAGAAIGAYMDKQAKKIEEEVEDAKVIRVEEGINLTFDSGILFGFDKSDLNTGAKQSITKLSKVLNEYPDTRLTIQGHTDSKGDDNYNRTLSSKRANAVRDYLVANGVKSNRLNTVAYGETSPVASNDTEAGRAKNRRVEVIIVANDELKRKADNGEIKE